jgi:hypothetical protein
MLNELLVIENHMRRSGITLATTDTKFVHIPKRESILARIDAKGGFSTSKVPEEKAAKMMYYVIDKNNTALAFKYSKEAKRPLKSIETGIQNFMDFAHKLDIKLLNDQAANIARIDPEAFRMHLEASYGDLKDFNVIFEDETDEIVQAAGMHRRIRGALEQLAKAGQASVSDRDSLGGSAFGVTTTGVDVKLRGASRSYQIPLYKRNPLNGCYTRYGLKGHELFPIGTESRQRLSAILDNLIKQKMLHSLLVNEKTFNLIASITPGDDYLLDPYAMPLDVSDWGQRSEKILQAILKQEETQSEAMVLAMFQPSNGPWSVIYHAYWNYVDIRRFVQVWNDGANNCPTYLPYGIKKAVPNLSTLTKVLSTTLSRSANEIRASEGHGWDIKDSLDFFAGKPGALKRAARLLGANILPYFVFRMGAPRALTTPTFWFENEEGKKKPTGFFDFIFPICGIILQNRGIDMTEQEANGHWAYRLGRLCNQADFIQKQYFEGKRLPSRTLGNMAMVTALTNPNRALNFLIKRMANPYEVWAERNKRSYQYQQLKASLIDVPQGMTDDERILLSAGYAWRPQPKPSEETVEV